MIHTLDSNMVVLAEIFFGKINMEEIWIAFGSEKHFC